MRFALLALLIATLAGCNRPVADVVLYNGVFYTGEQQAGTHSALAVAGGRVLALGDDRQIRRLGGAGTVHIDLKGAFVTPGFNDAHAHIHNAAVMKLGVDLFGLKSRQALLRAVRQAASAAAENEWITGRGWDQSLWDDQRLPTIEELEALAPGHPVFLKRADGHSALANSAALQAAEYNCIDEPPPGGVIVCEAGRMTGWIKERAASKLESLIPPLTAEQRRRAYRLVFDELLVNGVTSIQDDSIRYPAVGWQHYQVLQAMRQDGELPVRVTSWLPFEANIDTLLKWREQGGSDDAWLKTGLLKTNIDGSGGSLTAAMLEPYRTAPDNRGVLIMPEETLTQMVRERAEAGFQLGIHAIGDRANRVVLNALEAVQPAGKHLRHRLEHAQFLHNEDLPRLHALGVVASMQPCHLLTDMRWAPDILGHEREHEGYRWNRLAQSGAVLAFGTDYPVEPVTPLRGLYAAVTREFEAGGPAGGWIPQEKITIDQAIRAYTWGSAYAEHEEHRKGTLAIGMLADLVAWSDDLTAVEPHRILTAEALLTMVGGELRYRSKRL